MQIYVKNFFQIFYTRIPIQQQKLMRIRIRNPAFQPCDLKSWMDCSEDALLLLFFFTYN